MTKQLLARVESAESTVPQMLQDVEAAELPAFAAQNQSTVQITRIVLEGLLFALVLGWAAAFKSTVGAVLPGSAGLLAQIALLLIVTGGVVLYVQYAGTAT